MVKLRSEVSEWINERFCEFVMLRKYKQLHEYLTNLDENLDLRHFGPTEQPLLSF